MTIDLSKRSAATRVNGGIVTPWGVGSFVNIWEFKKPLDEGKEPSMYSITLLFDINEVNLKILAEDAETAGKAFFGPKWESVKGAKNFYAALRDGNEKFQLDEEKYAMYEGKASLEAKTKFNIPIFDADGKNVQRPMPGTPDPLYSGAIYSAIVSPWAYDNNSRGISWNLLALQKLAEGEKIGGVSVDAAAAFGIQEETKGDWTPFG